MYTLSRSSSEDQTFPPASAQPGHSPLHLPILVVLALQSHILPAVPAPRGRSFIRDDLPVAAGEKLSAHLLSRTQVPQIPNFVIGNYQSSVNCEALEFLSFSAIRFE
jgi:hypothetical protein